MNTKANGRKNEAISELDDHIGFWIRYVSNHVSSVFAHELSESGVTVSEWVAMRCLYDMGEGSQNELAAAMGMTKGPVSRILDRLLKKKLVSRKGSALDGRANVIRLTDAGRRLVPELAQIADHNDATFFSALSDTDCNSILRMMRKLVAHHGFVQVPVD
jgi:DNA-binding MarR family transcriptional regulator